MTVQVLVASVKFVHQRYQMRAHHNGTKNIFSRLFFLREASRMRTAMQSQNLKVTTYNSFFRQCKSKIKPWGGWQDHSTLKPSFQRKMNWLRFVVY